MNIKLKPANDNYDERYFLLQVAQQFVHSARVFFMAEKFAEADEALAFANNVFDEVALLDKEKAKCL